MRKAGHIVTCLMALLCLLAGVALADGALVLPAATQEIADEAFYGAASVTDVTLPEGVARIGERAFVESGLKRINLPDSLTYIAPNAFEGLSLERVDVNAGSYAAAYCAEKGIACDYGFTYLWKTIETGKCCITGYTGELPADLVIPATIDGNAVTEIGKSAFANNKSITSVTLPETLWRVWDEAFANCTSLSRVVFLSSRMYSLEDGVFKNCKNLTDVTLPSNGIQASIKSYVFENCTRLTTVHLPDSCSCIDYDAFINSGLTNINYPKDLMYLGWDYYSNTNSPFRGCPNLTSMIIPFGIENIPAYMFKNCTNLKKLYVPSSVKSVGSLYPYNNLRIEGHAFDGVTGTLVIYGEKGSFIEGYAKQIGMKFVACDLADFIDDTATINYPAVSGRVVDAQGNPQANAAVTLWKSDGFERVATVYTDKKGEWKVSSLALGKSYTATCALLPMQFTKQAFTVEKDVTILPDFVGTVTISDYVLLDEAGVCVLPDAMQHSLSLDALGAWNAVSDCDWLTVSPASGNGSAQLDVSAEANPGALRVGTITISSANVKAIFRVTQVAYGATRLPAPELTYPAADHDLVPFGDIEFTWNPVDGADQYILSLRDLTTDTLLLHHAAMGDATSTIISPQFFEDGHDYRVAIGAIPYGVADTHPMVSWRERLFTVPALEEEAFASLSGQVLIYQAIQSRGRGTDSERVKAIAVKDVSIKIYLVTGMEGGTETLALAKETTCDEQGKWNVWDLPTGQRYVVHFALNGYVFDSTAPIMLNSDRNIGTIYGMPEISIDAVSEALRDKIDESRHGLFAEYYQIANHKDKNLFCADNKRNEGIVDTIDFSWTGALEKHTMPKYGTASYYKLNARDFEKKKTRGSVDYVHNEKFAVRYNGYIVFPSAGDYALRLRGDDGVRLTLTGARCGYADKWSTGSQNIAELKLENTKADDIYYMVCEYFNKGGDSKVILEWKLNNGKWETVPNSALYPGERQTFISKLPNGVSNDELDKIQRLQKVDRFITQREWMNNMVTNMYVDVYKDVYKVAELSNKKYAKTLSNTFVKKTLEDTWHGIVATMAKYQVLNAENKQKLEEAINQGDEKQFWALVGEALPEFKAPFQEEFEPYNLMRNTQELMAWLNEETKIGEAIFDVLSNEGSFFEKSWKFISDSELTNALDDFEKNGKVKEIKKMMEQAWNVFKELSSPEASSKNRAHLMLYVRETRNYMKAAECFAQGNSTGMLNNFGVQGNGTYEEFIYHMNNTPNKNVTYIKSVMLDHTNLETLLLKETLMVLLDVSTQIYTLN